MTKTGTVGKRKDGIVFGINFWRVCSFLQKAVVCHCVISGNWKNGREVGTRGQIMVKKGLYLHFFASLILFFVNIHAIFAIELNK